MDPIKTMKRVNGKPGFAIWVMYSNSWFKDSGTTKTTFVRPSDPPIRLPSKEPIELIEVPKTPITIDFSQKGFETADGVKVDLILSVTVQPNLDLDPKKTDDVNLFSDCVAAYRRPVLADGSYATVASNETYAAEWLKRQTQSLFDKLAHEDFESLATANRSVATVRPDTEASRQPSPESEALLRAQSPNSTLATARELTRNLAFGLATRVEEQFAAMLRPHNFKVIAGTCTIRCDYPKTIAELKPDLPEHGPIIRFFEKTGTFGEELQLAHQKWIDDRDRQKRSHDEAQKEAQDAHQKKMDAMTNLHALATQKLVDTHTRAIQELKDENERATLTLKNKNDREKKQLEDEKTYALQELTEKHELAIQQLTDQHELRKEELKQQTEALTLKTSQTKQSLELDRKRLIEQHAQETRELENKLAFRAKEIENERTLKVKELEDLAVLKTKELERKLEEGLIEQDRALQEIKIHSGERQRKLELDEIEAAVTHAKGRGELEIVRLKQEANTAKDRFDVDSELVLLRGKEREREHRVALSELELARNLRAKVPQNESEIPFDFSQMLELKQLELEMRRKKHGDEMCAMDNKRQFEATMSELNAARQRQILDLEGAEKRHGFEIEFRREQQTAAVLPSLFEAQAALAQRDIESRDRNEFIRLSGEQIATALGAAKGMVDELKIVSSSGDAMARLFAAVQSILGDLMSMRTPSAKKQRLTPRREAVVEAGNEADVRSATKGGQSACDLSDTAEAGLVTERPPPSQSDGQAVTGRSEAMKDYEEGEG